MLSFQSAREQAVRAVILTPSKELCTQAYKKILVRLIFTKYD